MLINKLSVTVEPQKHPKPGQPTIVLLRIRVERYPGEPLEFIREVVENDLISLWKYVWDSTEEVVRREMME